MDQTILCSHLVLNNCIVNMLRDSMFRAQNCTNCQSKYTLLSTRETNHHIYKAQLCL